MNHIDRASHLLGVFRYCSRAESRVIAAYRHKMCNAKLSQCLYDRAQIRFSLRGIESRHLKYAAACKMYAAYPLHIETHVLLLPTGEMCESIPYAKDFPAMLVRLESYGLYHPVNTRRWSSAADDRYNIAYSYHVMIPPSRFLLYIGIFFKKYIFPAIIWNTGL